MKHFYCATTLIAMYLAIVLMSLEKYPHLVNGRMADLFGFSFTMWVMMAACVVALIYDPRRDETVRIGG